MRYSKYHASKVYIDGLKFDSKKEGERYKFLRSAEARGEISNLRTQISYKLTPCDTRYKADFVYLHNGFEIIEDVKGMFTDVYKIKREMMSKLLGLRINEITKPDAPIGSPDSRGEKG